MDQRQAWWLSCGPVPLAFIFKKQNLVQEQPRNLAQLADGESGVIAGFSDDELALKLMEMGCLPGEKVTINFRAPLGDPISIHVLDYNLSIRIREAATIILEP
ncbi:MAG: FeoA family protein [Bacteroidota bacterium]